jgi:dephospho-CoA kinase
MFADEGIAIFDADAAVHDMQKAGGELVGQIEAVFPGTTGPDGVDRKALGAAVLGDREKLTQLESIIHPAVAARRKEFLNAHSTADLLLFDIPLLFEKGGHAAVDVTVVVSAPHALQRERVLARPGMTPEKFEQILALQMDDADKRERADHIINTGRSIGETRDEVRDLVKKLRGGLA